MGSELVSGLSTTNGEPFNPLMTFVWDAIESGDKLEITVRYGVGAHTNNIAAAEFGLGQTGPVKIAGQSGTTPKAEVSGTLTAAWANNNTSYVVTFSGFMLVASVNNILSSDQNGTPGDRAKIIVCANLAS